MLNERLDLDCPTPFPRDSQQLLLAERMLEEHFILPVPIAPSS